ncbi:NAD(P)-dependent dehydrogenase (short-subunit alcohol dehydrogenase family) [Altererythrobacter atlanticus]|uniref:Gluconate 5-dehydrogenase n=1 Tax=Croceibacterium atlanticum TaxID=1267766 RepID=A0A0F7KW23_9SPHN|nr:SDR family NAD(P)-dependent oxidoreductase [Croceibacterium atlanticum]AKH43909.1 Gluconate 5-dehydrogenase [Croceibacterium atlanticum]MBB5733641.1 NAD(P)-dependent dehydrogenase (short-subunit alcohol dehydrogenase family) [Croceibacterium atlanticum]
MEPAGKCAVVTGGNSGLGRATAEWLAAAGAKVVSLDPTGEAPDGVRHIACDVSDHAAVQAAVDSIDGPIHILINCAGIGGIGPIASAEGPGDMAAFRKVVEVNLLGAANVTAAVAARMIGNDPVGEDGERGAIVNACSIASFEGQEGMGAYTASKSAMAGLCLVWARDLSRHGIRVNGIAPGFMATPMVAHLPDDFVAELLADTEFPKRAGRAEEFAEVVDFVLHTPLLNGEVIRLDAGARPPARTKWSMD